MQFSPLLKKQADKELLTAFERSQSSKMIKGDFPPNSSDTFFKLLSAQDAIMVFPTIPS
jgi:hypothetical protein